jgi:hypothetical protein
MNVYVFQVAQIRILQIVQLCRLDVHLVQIMLMIFLKILNSANSTGRCVTEVLPVDSG